jgi:hypothetical protein
MSETGAAPAAAPSAPVNGAAPPNGAPPTEGAAAAPPPPSEYEIKVGGEVRKVKPEHVRKVLGMKADEEIHPRDIRAMQIELASRQRWSEASEREKQAAAEAAMLETDPVAALAKRKFGGDKIKARQALITTLGAQINEELMPADERARLERQRELEAAEKELRERKEREQKSEYERQVDQNAQAIGKQLAAELTAVGVTPTPKTIADFAAHVMGRQQEGRPIRSQAELREIAAEVRAEAQESARGSLSSLEGEALIEYLGEEVVKKIRTHDANRIRRELGQRPVTQTTQTKPQPGVKPKTTQQVLDEIRGTKR